MKQSDDLPLTVGDALEQVRVSTDELIAGQALLGHVTGKDRAWLLAHREVTLSLSQAEHFSCLLSRLAMGEPLAYLTGRQEFYGRSFHVTPDVLIPRPETEDLVTGVIQWVEQRGKTSVKIVDVGTGSGIIAVTLALELPETILTAVDISMAALHIARKNAVLHSVGRRIRFVNGSLLEALTGPFDVIAANLPYISPDALETLDVRRWEPSVALMGGKDGLKIIGKLLQQAPSRLAQSGLLTLEIGFDQGTQAVALCQKAFPNGRVNIYQDLAGLDRRVEVIIP